MIEQTRFTMTGTRRFTGNATTYYCFLIEVNGIALGELSVPEPFVDELQNRLTDYVEPRGDSQKE